MTPPEPLVLALDLGTTSLKAALVDRACVVAASEVEPYAVDTPHAGWAETDPEAWWLAARRAVGRLPGDLRARVRAVGMAGQMHGVVMTADGGEPLRPAVLWSDGRSAAALDAYRALPPALRARLANPLVAGMAGPTLVWLARHEPETLARARWALQPKDWVRMRLTGAAATDPSDASGTLLYDLPADRWAEEVAAALGLDASLLPSVRPSDDVAGTLRMGAAAALGIPEGVPVVTGAADTAAAAVGGGLTQPGDGQLNVGSGAQIVVLTEEPGRAPGGRGAGSTPGNAPEPVTHLFRTAQPRGHYRLAAMQNAGLALQWVCGVLGLSWEELYAGFDASRISPDLAFLPYLTGERTPLLDPAAFGGWVGLRAHHTRADLTVAALAGVAFAVRDGFDALTAAGARPRSLRLSGGGARSDGFAQLLCDLLGVELVRATSPHATALGAAMLAWGAVGESVVPGATTGAAFSPRPVPQNVQRARDRFLEARERLLGETRP